MKPAVLQRTAKRTADCMAVQMTALHIKNFAHGTPFTVLLAARSFEHDYGGARQQSGDDFAALTRKSSYLAEYEGV